MTTIEQAIKQIVRDYQPQEWLVERIDDVEFEVSVPRTGGVFIEASGATLYLEGDNGKIVASIRIHSEYFDCTTEGGQKALADFNHALFALEYIAGEIIARGVEIWGEVTSMRRYRLEPRIQGNRSRIEGAVAVMQWYLVYDVDVYVGGRKVRDYVNVSQSSAGRLLRVAAGEGITPESLIDDGPWWLSGK